MRATAHGRSGSCKRRSARHRRTGPGGESGTLFGPESGCTRRSLQRRRRRRRSSSAATRVDPIAHTPLLRWQRQLCSSHRRAVEVAPPVVKARASSSRRSRRLLRPWQLCSSHRGAVRTAEATSAVTGMGSTAQGRTGRCRLERCALWTPQPCTDPGSRRIVDVSSARAGVVFCKRHRAVIGGVSEPRNASARERGRRDSVGWGCDKSARSRRTVSSTPALNHSRSSVR